MASCGEVKLLGAWVSPFAKRVEWVLKLKGIEFEYVEQNLKDKSPTLLKYNPIHKKVPVLVHGGNPVIESLLIIEYAEDTWPENPILPKDPYERAQARFWAKFVDEKFSETMREILFVYGRRNDAESAEEAAEALEVLERELTKMGSKFFGGDTIGLVDITLGWITIWLNVIEEVAGVKVFDAERFPTLSRWSESFKELPVIKNSTIPPREHLLAYYHKIRQYSLALSAAEK